MKSVVKALQPTGEICALSPGFPSLIFLTQSFYILNLLAGSELPSRLLQHEASVGRNNFLEL